MAKAKRSLQMSYGILKFNLSKQEYRDEFSMAQRSSDYHRALSEIRERLRAKRKYGNEDWAAKAEDLLFEVLKEMEIKV